MMRTVGRVAVVVLAACSPERAPSVAPASVAVPVNAAAGGADGAPRAEPSAGMVAPIEQGARVPDLESEAQLRVWLDGSCFAFSEKLRQIACVEAELDMGGVMAHVALLSIDDRDKPKSVVVYEGPSEIDASKHDQAAIDALNARLREGGFAPGGKPFDGDAVVRTPDGFFRADLEGVTMAYMIPKFRKEDAPLGFNGDPNACMTWEPAGGTSFGWAAAIRLESNHTFTTAKGPCQFAGADDLNDETFPGISRWLVVTAK